MIGGKLPPDAQPSSDCEEQDDISSQMEKLEGKLAEKKRNEEDLFSSDEDNRRNWKENWQKRKEMRRTYSPVMKITGQLPLWMR